MKKEIKQKIIADYISDRNKRAGLALKAKMPTDYYKRIGAMSNKNKIKGGGLDTSTAGMVN